MAVFDGEETDFKPEELNAHLADCMNCRAEIEQLQAAFNSFKTSRRRELKADLWGKIEPRLENKISRKPFVLVALLLIAWKLAEMLPEADFGLVFKIVPLIIAAGLFAFLRLNPFRINTEFILEK